MRVAITGASGLIGRALSESLLADGHEVLRLVRREPRGRLPDGSGEARWDPRTGRLDAALLEGCGAVVGLAGAGVADHRWSAAYKQEIRDSRVNGTATLAKAIAALDPGPPVFVSGSAVGYYGDTGALAVDESAGPGRDFLAGVCREWEAAAAPAAASGVRVVHPRFGIVLASGGGAFGRLLPLARKGLGGRIGDGRQYWSYISLPDTVSALRHLITAEGLDGPVNLTAPNPATNREITETLGRALHRPTRAVVPGLALRLALGGFAEGILMSQRVLPARLLASGFVFAHPTAQAAIESAL